MKLVALLLVAGVTVVGASVLILTGAEREEIQGVPLLPPDGSAPEAEHDDHTIAPPQPVADGAETTTGSTERRRRGSSIVDVEPQGAGFSEGQNDFDEDDDCETDDEEFPFCDGDRPGDD